ncbi:MAG TPA: carboxypeptidase regulatory-like domain-containing protein [Thermoanaerobaculia bacterium]|jgi:ELWxxDGT repeat protein|nr:carboxypeptidase regulatory-like domain-containing protein [Thermoanaerobaculia bacterium]
MVPLKSRPFRLALVLLFAAGVMARPRLVPIADAFAATGQSSDPHSFVRLGSQVLFLANDATHGESLWRTDGTAGGTSLVQDRQPGQYPSILGTAGGAAIVMTYETGLRAIWSSDGTPAGTFRIALLPTPADTAGYYIQAVGAGARLFILVQQNYGSPIELWSTDGTLAGTRKAGQYPISFTPAPLGGNGNLYFVGADDIVGPQLWVSDGTALGTHMVRRSVECPGSSCGPRPTSFVRIGAMAAFTTSDALWKTDGTPEGTTQIVPLPEVTPLVSGPVAYFANRNQVMWRSDGTAAGTRQIGTVPEIISASSLAVLDDGRLVFLRYRTGFIDVWKSDGTAAGTLRVASAPNTAGPQTELGFIGNRVFLGTGAAATGQELWTVDIDTGSAALVRDIDLRIDYSGANSSRPGAGVTLGGRYLFPATTVAGRELWQTDGTADGTTLLANIAPDQGAGIVSGTVRDAATGNPVAAANVFLCNAVRCDDYARSAASGTYRFEGVIPGSYRVQAGSAAHVSQFYEGVTVTSGFETAGIDFSLIKGATIGGTVRRASTAEPVPGVLIWIRDGSGNLVDQVASSYPSGEYKSHSLVSGSYTVETHSEGYTFNGDPTIDQVYPGYNCPVSGCSWSAGTPVTVTTGVDTTGIDFSLHGYGTIAGTIRDASTGGTEKGTAVSFIRVGSSSAAVSVATDANGRYVSPLLVPGSYYVEASGFGFNTFVYPATQCTAYPCDRSGATPVAVEIDGAAAGIDISLTVNKARLTGILRDRAGTPLTLMNLALYDANGFYVSSYPTATSNADGRFTFAGWPAGTYYLHALDELYPNVDCPYSPCNVTNATPIVLTEGQTVTRDMQLLSRQTSISGRILDAVTAQPISGGFPTVQVWLRGTARGNYEGTSSGSLDGSYFAKVLSRETSFYVVASGPGYHTMAYQNVRADCPIGESCPVPAGATPVPAGTSANIDIALPRFGAITGTVYDVNTGKALPGVTVRFYSAASVSVGYAVSDANGRYRWQGANGSYYADVSQYRYDPQVYADRNCTGSCDPRTGNLVAVPDGTDVTGIDFHLRPSVVYGNIAGRVVDDLTGAGVADVLVAATTGSLSARTDAQGNYTLGSDGVPNGQYRLYVEAGSPYLIGLSGGGSCGDFNDCHAAGTPVQVTSPNTATVNFRLLRLSVTSVSPAQGPTGGGTHIAVTGANFTPRSTLMIGSQNATIFSVTATRIEAITPAVSAPGLAHVTVTIGPNLFVALTHGFTYAANAPIIDARGLQSGIAVHAELPGGTSAATLYRRPAGTSSWAAVSGWTPQGELDPSGPLRGVVYEYRVEALVAGNAVSSNVDYALLFTDDPVLAGGTVVRGVHLDELRLLVNAMRAAGGLAPFNFDASYSQLVIRATHLAGLRTALAEARQRLGLSAPQFSGTIAAGALIRGADVQELREQAR